MDNISNDYYSMDDSSDSELSSADFEDSEEIENHNNLLELKVGLTFGSFKEFKAWIECFAKKEGFSYRIRTSTIDGDIVRHAIYECSRSGTHQPLVTTDPTKRRNMSSQRTECSWHLNLTCPKTNNILKINSFKDEHNHVLTLTINEIASRFRRLIPKMLSDIKKYVLQDRMDSGSIYPLLKHDYPNQSIFKKDLYNAVYRFRTENNPGDSDASQMLQILMNWKESDPSWVVKLYLDP
ncbi:11336_t:CDS:1, partial [Racocetra persica]